MSNFQINDYVKWEKEGTTYFGRIVSVNKKTVTVSIDYDWVEKVPFSGSVKTSQPQRGIFEKKFTVMLPSPLSTGLMRYISSDSISVEEKSLHSVL